MEKKKLNSYEEIMEILNDLDRERKIISSQLAVMGISLFNEKAKEKKKKLKRRLKEMKHIYKYFNELFMEYTTFDSEILLPFLAEYLSKNTDTKYAVCNGEDVVLCGRTYSYYYYKFIYPVRDLLKFKHNGYDIDDNLDYDSLKENANHRFICLDSDSTYTLMNLESLMKEFKEFPELEEVVRRLINLKLAYPKMSDEERLARSLRTVKTNRNYKKLLYIKKESDYSKLSEMSLSEIYSIKK